MELKLQFNEASKLLSKSKLMLVDFENKYPDDLEIINRLKDSILKIQEQYYLLKSKMPIDWDNIQLEYEKYCDTFSPAYLSGAMWYRFIQKFKTDRGIHGDFKKAYYYRNLKNYLVQK